ADLVNLAAGDGPDDGAAVGQQIDDADAGEADEGFTDGRVADAEAGGQLLRNEVLAGAEASLEDVGKQRFDDDLTAQAVVTAQGGSRDRGGHQWCPRRCGEGKSSGGKAIYGMIRARGRGGQEDSVESCRDSVEWAEERAAVR